ncbi:MAG TPA: hypothetical protein VJT16_03035 [Streptosporangiaceae bacterium]|nr:hypothetical protein [Streptosporangiaceae bacterium]
MSSMSSHENDVPVEAQSGYAGSHRTDVGNESAPSPAAVGAEDVVVIERDEPNDSSASDAAAEREATPVTVWSPGVPSASAPAAAVSRKQTDPEQPDANAPRDGAERWSEIKALFVDDPGESVNRASGLVERAMENLITTLRERRDSLTSWQPDDSAGTEELRKALRSYQSLFDQLVGMSGQFRADRDHAAEV